MHAARFALLLLVLPLLGAYALVPAQHAALVRVWTDNGTYAHEMDSPTVLNATRVRFVALDTDSNGVFDRGGVPDGDVITLVPVGMVRGTVNGEAVVAVHCPNPGLTDIPVTDSFLIVAPAGDCVLTATHGTETQTLRLTVEANAVTDVSFRFNNYTAGAIAGVILLVLIGGIGYGVARYVNNKKDPYAGMLAMLAPEDRRVAHYLRTRGPAIAGVVRKDLQIPKTSFHRITKRLLDRELIVAEDYGNTERFAWNESFQPK